VEKAAHKLSFDWDVVRRFSRLKSWVVFLGCRQHHVGFSEQEEEMKRREFYLNPPHARMRL